MIFSKPDLAAINSKEFLTFKEAAWYLGVSKSHLYHLTSEGKIPHYKPTGKMLYFNRSELVQWLQCSKHPKFKQHETR